MARSWSRREILALGAAGVVASCARGESLDGSASSTRALSTSTVHDSVLQVPRVGPSAADLPPYEVSEHFPEGIMSGDPDANSVVLWTRPSPDLVAGEQELVVELASDTWFARPVATATQRPDPQREGACTFVVDGLEAGTAYFYRFRIGDVVSPIGLTRTAPAPGDDVEALRVAVFSCQRWTHGYYTAHADLAAQTPDLVLSLGDYVYETGFADGVIVPGREDPIQEARTLEDFRRKYELYRSDVNLQMVHRVAPLVAIPDNHDGGLPDDDSTPGAHEAFFEKMPVRQDPVDNFRTHRRITWGRLLDLWMLDLHRFRTPGSRGSGNTAADLDMMDPEVTYLGAEQRGWLFGGLADTTAVWQVLGSPKQFSPLRIALDTESGVPNGGTYINLSQWDGYQAERMAILEEVERRGRTGTVVVSGDMHWFWAADVAKDFDDPAATPILVDLLCGGISSSNADERIGGDGPQTPALLEAFGPANQAYARYFDGDRHGYALITFRPDGAEVQYRSPLSIVEPTSEVEVVARFTLDPEQPGVRLTEAIGWDPATGLPSSVAP